MFLHIPVEQILRVQGPIVYNLDREHTWRGTEHAPISHTLKFLETNFCLEPTSHNPMSPTLVPTEAPIENTQKLISSLSIQSLRKNRNRPITILSSQPKAYIRKKSSRKGRPKSRVCCTGWKSMLIGDDPWVRFRTRVLGKSSGALKAWLWPCPGNVTGNTLTGRFTYTQIKKHHENK